MDIPDRATNPYSGPRTRRSIHDRSELRSSPPKPASPKFPSPKSLLSKPSSKPSSPILQRNERLHNLPSDFSDSDSEKEVQVSHSTNYLSSDNSSFLNSTNETHFTHYSRVSNTSRSSPKPLEHDKPPPEDTTPFWILYIVAALFVFFAIYYAFSNPTAQLKPIPKIDCPQFKELTQQFTNQDIVLWKSLKIGIENVLNGTPDKPSIFLLAYSDPITSRKVMSRILNATAACMKSKHPIQLDGSTFATDEMIHDYGEFIAKYKKRLENNGILYVSDLNKTPAEVAQVFHTVCDTITPLVNRAVIFFTIRLDKITKDIEQRDLLRIVEKNLENNWNKEYKVSEDTLSALIARVTDQVFLLRSENE